MGTPTTHAPLTEADYRQIAEDLSLVFWCALALQRGNSLLHSDAAALLLAATRLQTLSAVLIPVVFGHGL
jgi:hypothetical protein